MSELDPESSTFEIVMNIIVQIIIYSLVIAILFPYIELSYQHVKTIYDVLIRF